MTGDLVESDEWGLAFWTRTLHAHPAHQTNLIPGVHVIPVPAVIIKELAGLPPASFAKSQYQFCDICAYEH